MTDKPKDPPIVEMDYLSGLKVIDIGDIRVARGMSRRPHSSCNHRAMVYDPKERRVWCKDCETDVEPFDAFEILCQNYGAAVERIKRDRAAVEEAKEHNLIRIAAKQMDEHFRQRNMVPAWRYYT